MEGDNITIRLSVRELVELTMREGSIEEGGGFADRAAEGARIHRQLQGEGGDNYRAEVPLSHTCEQEGFKFVVEGRADGIIEESQGVIIDEIKSVDAPLSLLPEGGAGQHWAQAQCYAFFYCAKEGLLNIMVRLTYIEAETGKTKRFSRELSFDGLKRFYSGLIERYMPWAKSLALRRRELALSAGALAFPHPEYRMGQKRMAAEVYRAVRDGERLFCQAPTGIGKTMSSVFPAIKAMGEKRADKLFYLTAKTTTREAAQSALETLINLGLKARAVTITAKDKICFMDQMRCDGAFCPYAKGYYDRVNAAVLETLEKPGMLGREEIERIAREKELCPYVFSLDLAFWCECVVCDYNYVFDPSVRLARLCALKEDRAVFLIDEAHNLAERSREMFSAAMCKSDIMALKRAMDEKSPVTRALKRMNSQMLKFKEACGEKGLFSCDEPPDGFIDALGVFTAESSAWLKANGGDERAPEVLRLMFTARFFMRIAQFYGDNYVTLYERQGAEVTVKLLCLDPSRLLDAAMKRASAAVLFSATLSPLDYYISVLGGGRARRLSLPSPFDPGRFFIAAAVRINLRYAVRDINAGQVARLIHDFISAKRGNYIVYFPSYKYLSEVYGRFVEEFDDINVYVQQSNSDEAGRKAFIDGFYEGGERVGFCVLGGVYSEGIDLSGERLIGAAVVGVGLAQINAQLELLRGYYDGAGLCGFDYAYRYPGFNKVMQAAGRVIRSENDKGAVLLIDSRYASPEYRALLPRHWSHIKTVYASGELKALLHTFWKDD